MHTSRWRKRVEGFTLTFLERLKARSQPLFLHPVIFISGFVCLGLLFALQSWNSARIWSYRLDLGLLLKAWGVQYLIWGTICWLLWFWYGPRIQQLTIWRMVAAVLPFSILVAVVEEMLWVYCIPNWPIRRREMDYWKRLTFMLDGEMVDNLVIFWCTFFLVRGIGYYQKFREKEHAAAQLEIEVIQAQMRALRMQLNPHFLFNTLNSISSLMRTDVAAADTMLEQLSSLLRIALERREVQLIPLTDEMEFVEMYLEIQDQRYTGRIREEIRIDPELHDALVPAMILQPIVENAFAHGLSRLDSGGLLVVEARRENENLKLTVLNNGAGVNAEMATARSSQGVGLANVKNRLWLHYGADQMFSLDEIDTGKVLATITLPLQFAKSPTAKFTGYGV
jgi:two-component system, LytTR family, sensor kinase